MSLIHPAPIESLQAPKDISLEGMDAERAITVVRAIDTYGNEVQQDLSAPSEIIDIASEDSRAVMRDAVRHSYRNPSARGLAPTLESLDSQDTWDSPHAAVVEDALFSSVFPERTDVSKPVVKFMAYCLLRQQSAQRNKVQAEEAKQAFKWLQQHPETEDVVEEILHPVSRAVRTAAVKAGRGAVKTLVPTPGRHRAHRRLAR
jgi:hypothetical protein